jgi:uncharacterized membrane protein
MVETAAFYLSEKLEKQPRRTRETSRSRSEATRPRQASPQASEAVAYGLVRPGGGAVPKGR